MIIEPNFILNPTIQVCDCCTESMVDSCLLSPENDVVLDNKFNSEISGLKPHINKHNFDNGICKSHLDSEDKGCMDYKSSSDTEYEHSSTCSLRNSITSLNLNGLKGLKYDFVTPEIDLLTPVSIDQKTFNLNGFDRNGDLIKFDEEACFKNENTNDPSKENEVCMKRHLAEVSKKYGLETTIVPALESFFVANLASVEKQYERWINTLPRIAPFYAVKCNPDRHVVEKLHKSGTGFDCASKEEIEIALSVGVDPKNIIFANPCKQISHILFARKVGVKMMTFDNVDELLKMKNYYPQAEAIMRLHTDDSRSVCRLGVKFGSPMSQIPTLLSTAKEIGVNVIGVSFHVGSGCFDANAFEEAILRARKAFDIGKDFGFDFTLLDVGGGFPSAIASTGLRFEEIASVLGPAVDKFFGNDPNVRVIAEPGRFFVSAAYSLATNVIARRVIPADSTGTEAAEVNNTSASFINETSTVTPFISVNDAESSVSSGVDILSSTDSGSSGSFVETAAEAPAPYSPLVVGHSNGLGNNASSVASNSSAMKSSYYGLTSVSIPNEESSFMYYLNDGVYGSFNCIMFDHYTPVPHILYRQQVSDVKNAACSLWGPTCDGIDCLGKDFKLPELNIGDWLVFHNMGAYTVAAASTFNGFPRSKVIYIN